MKTSGKHSQFEKAIAALVISIGFIFPSISWAWGPGPVGVSTPTYLYLDEEKKFLDEFHAKKKEIISNPNWRETAEGSYVLELADSTNPAGEKTPLRFVMVPQKSEFRFWNMYAQQKAKNQWEYKYKGSPLGYVDNGESREPKFVTYLNSSSIESALTKLKIPYQQARVIPDAPIDPALIVDNYPSAAVGIACKDIINEYYEDDKHGMVPTVFDVLPEEYENAVRTYKNYQGLKSEVMGTPNVNMNGSVFGPKKRTYVDDAIIALGRKSRDEAFKTTLAGVVNFQHRFYSKLTLENWMKVLKDPKNVSDSTVNSGDYQRLVQQNISNVIPLSKPTLTTDEKLKAIAKLNALHKSINASCAEANKSYSTSDSSIGYIPHGEKPYTASDRQVMDFNRQNRIARANLEAKYKNQFTPMIKAELATNDLGVLFGSEKFQDKVGTFDAEDCFKTGKSGLNENISLADVYLGESESSKNLFEALDDRIEEFQINGYTSEYLDIIKKYVVSYPLMIKGINAGLTRPSDIQQLRLSCVAIGDVYHDEKIEQFLDYGFMGVAFIAGALTAGAGAAVVLSVAGGVTAIEATEAGLDWYGGYQLQSNGRKGLLTGNNTVNGALSVIDRGKVIVTKGKWDFGLTMVSFGAGDILAESYKATRAATRTANITQDAVTKGADDVRHLRPVEVTPPKPVQEIPVKSRSATSLDRSEQVDLKIAAGTGAKQTNGVVEELSQEFIEANQKIQKKLGDKYRLIHIEDGDGLVVNPRGELQNIYIYKETFELESTVVSKSVKNITWEIQGKSIIKKVKLDDGIVIQISDQPKQMLVTMSNGKTILAKTDSSIDDMMSTFLISTKDQAVEIAEGVVFRSGDRILLVKPDGTVFKGERIGSEVVFSNQAQEIYINAARHPILTIQDAKWGKPATWQRVTWDDGTSDLSEFEVPTLKDDGFPSGYGDINCSGLSFSGDAWLSKKSPLSCALPDAHFRDIVGSDKGLDDVVGKSPTVTPQNAATHYSSTHEIFNEYTAVHDRLMKMQDGGTALVYVKDTNGFAHVFNARKEGGRVVYYDFQARTISTDPRAQFFNNRTNKIDIVETTQYHLTQ